MKFKARGIGHGSASGKVVLSRSPISFLGGVDPSTGKIADQTSDSICQSISGSVFAFPHGKGSTVGSFVIYQMMKSGTAPAAIVNEQAENIVATGAILAGIPMLNRVPLDILRNDDSAIVDADEGFIEIADVIHRPIVTSILKHDDEILVLRRSDSVSTYRGHWAGVSGAISEGEKPLEAALREVKEETGVPASDSSVSAIGDRIYARDHGTLWEVTPFLINVGQREITIDWEHDEYMWISPEKINDLKTVPNLERVVRSLLEKDHRSGQTKVC